MKSSNHKQIYNSENILEFKYYEALKLSLRTIDYEIYV